MLDTNIISDLIRNPQGRAAKRIAKGGEDKHHRPRTQRRNGFRANQEGED
jgi:hypothetical protein